MILYHNITKQLFNIKDIDTVINLLNEGDVIMYSNDLDARLEYMNKAEYDNLIAEHNKRFPPVENKTE